MEQFNLNTVPGKVAPVCNSSQYDTGRKIRVYLFEGSQVYTLDGTEVVSVSVRKPDGHIVTEGVTNTGAEYVEIVTTEQMTACAGDNLCELKIEKGGDVIGTLNFILRVELDPLAGGDPSESFVYNLQTQIAAAVADQYDSNAVIFDPAPTAGHGVGYAVTSEGVKNYVDASIGGLSIPEDLNDLDDVDTTTPTQGEALVWDGTKWVNGTVSTVGSLDDLNDVDTTGEADCDSLVYDANSGNWLPHRLIVSLTQAEFDTLEQGGNLEPNTDYIITDSSSVDLNLGDLTDVDTTGASTGDILVKGASGWESTANSYNNLTDTPDFTQKTVTGVGCNVLNGGYVEFGDFVYLSVCVKMTTNHSGDKFLSGLPWSLHDGQCIFGMKTADTSNALVSARVYQGGLYVNTNMGNGIEYTFNGVLCK